MDTQPVIDTFSNMILGVNLSTTLEPHEKDYIIQLLADKLNTELICAEMA